MKNFILLFVVIIISSTSILAEEFTKEFNHVYITADDSLIVSKASPCKVVFNYNNKSGFLQVTINEKIFLLEPVSLSTTEDDEIQIHKMRTNDGKIFFAAYDLENFYLATKIEGIVVLIVLGQTEEQVRNTPNSKSDNYNTDNIYTL